MEQKRLDDFFADFKLSSNFKNLGPYAKIQIQNDKKMKIFLRFDLDPFNTNRWA